MSRLSCLHALLGASLLLACTGCSQKWEFARADQPISAQRLPGPEYPTASSIAAVSPAEAPAIRPYRLPAAGAPTVIPAGGTWSEPVFAPPSDSLVDSTVLASQHVLEPPEAYESRRPSRLRRAWWNVRSDHANYYRWSTMRDLLYGVAAGSLLANTSLDDDFQTWYRDDVRSKGTEDFASFWNTFGEGQIFIPAFACLAVVGSALEERPLFNLTGDFSGRVTRTYLVGAPPMLFMQAALGASRPGESAVGSRWNAFQDTNAVSGHAFVGAVPFITAAQMTENPWAKGCLYFCSVLTPWSRIDRDAHYLSQACLGWWMAYLACRAVDDTQLQERNLALAPVVTPEWAGVGLTYRR